LTKRNEILDWLFSLRRFGIKPGLERTLELDRYCGNPRSDFQSVHIAGTNGKGAVASVIASALMESGLKTALYTSPHLTSFNERMCIGKKLISDDELVRLAEELMPKAKQIGATFFEITTVMAFKWFAEHGAEIAVVETGMGGRFDSTNIIDPELSVITPVDMDHSEFLGHTIREIAFEKAGIIKENKPVIIAPSNSGILDVFGDIARKKSASLIDPASISEININNFNKDFSTNIDIKSENINLQNIKCPLAGRHQAENISTSLAALRNLSAEFRPGRDSIAKGIENIIENCGYRARTELLRPEPPVLIDTGHNPAAIRILADTLSLHRPGERWTLVYGAMADKDIDGVLKILSPFCNKIIATQPQTGRAATAQSLARSAVKAEFDDIIIIPDVAGALDEAIDSKGSVLIVGSFYLAGEALPTLENILR
jgi:dihydrofolate synthase/folylpolyglutamate synthase